MYRKATLYTLVAAVLLALAFGAGRLSAAGGTLDSPGPPGDPASASYTLEDIYRRLDTGVAGAPGTFSEPTSGPTAGTGHTLNGVMAVAPALDDTAGAARTDVLTGTTLWGLTSGQWGPLTGTMPRYDAAVITPTTVSQAIAAGYHDGSGYVEGDADLVAGNIRSGVSIFGVAGNPYVVNTSAGGANATAGLVCSNKRAWVNGVLIVGTNSCGCSGPICTSCSVCLPTEYWSGTSCEPKLVYGAFCTDWCMCLSGYCHTGGAYDNNIGNTVSMLAPRR